MKLYRMELSIRSQVPTAPQSIEIIRYCSFLHRNHIPQIYSESFGEEPWTDDWEDFDKFDPNGVFLAILDFIHSCSILVKMFEAILDKA